MLSVLEVTVDAHFRIWTVFQEQLVEVRRGVAKVLLDGLLLVVH